MHTSPGGVVTVTGGKLTTYRRMAADAVDEVVEGARPGRPQPHQAHPRCTAPTVGTRPTSRSTSASATAPTGARSPRSSGPIPQLARPLIESLPYSRAEVVYAARAEMARTVDDVLSRRTRARLLARDASAAVADDVAALMAAELGWSDDERERQVAEYRALIAEERLAGGLPETALDALSHPPGLIP